jgi:hypothetical protein
MGHHKHHYSMKNFLHDAGKVTIPLNKDVNHLVDTQANIANNLISTLSSLSLPLIIVGGCVAIYYVTKK